MCAVGTLPVHPSTSLASMFLEWSQNYLKAKRHISCGVTNRSGHLAIMTNYFSSLTDGNSREVLGHVFFQSCKVKLFHAELFTSFHHIIIIAELPSQKNSRKYSHLDCLMTHVNKLMLL